MKYSELYRKLEKSGWYVARTKKHHIYKHKEIEGVLVVGKHS